MRLRLRLLLLFQSDAGWEEYYDYIFPDDESAKPNLKLLAMAKQWKEKTEDNDDDEEDDEDEESEEESDEEEEEQMVSRAPVQAPKVVAGSDEASAQKSMAEYAAMDADSDGESNSSSSESESEDEESPKKKKKKKLWERKE